MHGHPVPNNGTMCNKWNVPHWHNLYEPCSAT